MRGGLGGLLILTGLALTLETACGSNPTTAGGQSNGSSTSVPTLAPAGGGSSTSVPTLAPAAVGFGQCRQAGPNGGTYPAPDGTEVAQINPGSVPCPTAVDVAMGADAAMGVPTVSAKSVPRCPS